LYLAENQDIQDKMRQELQVAFPDNALPRWSDRHLTPYTEACLHEVQRCADLLPLGLPHMATSDCYVGGYFIEKGTAVAGHLSMVHYNENLFPEPKKIKYGLINDDY